MSKCISLKVVMGLILPGMPGIADTVTYFYDEKNNGDELTNVTPKNAMRVGGAIGKRRLSRENQVVGYPISVEAKFDE